MTSAFAKFARPVDVPARCIIKDTNGDAITDADGKEAFIDLLPLNSSVARRLDEQMADKRLAQRKIKPLTSKEIADAQIGKIAALTKAWHLVLPDGTVMDVECNEANARDLYAEPSFDWIRQQVEEFLFDRSNFFQNLPGGSK